MSRAEQSRAEQSRAEQSRAEQKLGEYTQVEKLDLTSKDVLSDNITKIGQLFPEVLTESSDENGRLRPAIDFEKLRQFLSRDIVEGRESYEFTWVGKRGAIAEAGKPTHKTLRPDLEESVDFDKSENIFITGDNLEVLKVLQESYLGKIDMVYIDPPYNTGKDFVYSDKFQMSEEELADEMDLRDEDGLQRVGLTKNEKSSARYHSDWLNMMYPRLVLARNLLKDSGVIFISIDDNEQANLKAICDEIFGEENFVGSLIHQRAKGGGQAKFVVKGHDVIHVYARRIEFLSPLVKPKVIQGKIISKNGIDYLKNDDIYRKQFGKYEKGTERRLYYEDALEVKGQKIKDEIDNRLSAGEIFLEERENGKHILYSLTPVSEATSKLYSIIKVLSEEGKNRLEDLGIDELFSYPKPTDLIKQIVQTHNRKQMLILDFFAGSATTADAVMQLNAEDGGNRKYILCTLDEHVADKSAAKEAGYETIDQISRVRIRRAAKKIQEEHPETVGKQDFGFRAYKLDTSNFKDVSQTPDSFSQESLFDSVSNIKDGRTDLDLLFQIMLTWGMELSLSITKTQIDDTDVYNVADGALIACFADEISESVLRQIAKEEPLRAVFKDESFANSAAKINLGQIFKEEAPNTKVKVV
ncbi:site-specific DNA-methyltransferase [Streptococcus suis]|uniref:site-specific DNA-methyltransferase n=1 Tax=Streptococcus suis TaxID=1307 RepID=UPI001FC90762|nr:site-specific DNA-methyltransferase [Streptococcus suis]MDG4485762.1 site-specific DNA-methyltransferase [Streptococcus suis]